MPGKCVRGDILDITLDPTVGHEIKKTRPCLVVQNDIGNRFSARTVVVPLEGAGPFCRSIATALCGDRTRMFTPPPDREPSSARSRRQRDWTPILIPPCLCIRGSCEPRTARGPFLLVNLRL